MRYLAAGSLLLTVGLAVALVTRADEPAPKTGPATEQRFPPLQVPKGFKATLFACDPLIEYPSVIAAGPTAKSLFVAIDYMTGLGIEIVRRDEIRLIEDTDGDGYADKATVIAGGFNSIQGLAYHDGAIHVMHAPFLTVLRDVDGSGKFAERRDLLSGLGLKPEDNPPRLHCANGVTVGHDGWLYLSLGDHGCNVERPEGDRLIFNGGGILRCRPDGRDLHVFATGLRNIYDVALDAELNVFVRDNENDGGDYMIRVCHSFFGADHGYPYLYRETPEEAMRPIADLGRGSSAGVVCYLENAFPKDYRGSLFACEWGRSLVTYDLKRAGSGFAPTQEVEFAAGAPKDPYGFKPTDVVVQRDGALMVSDWCDGQRPKRGRGRIYRIAPSDQRMSAKNRDDAERASLDSDSYFSRIQAQASLARRGGASSVLLVSPGSGGYGPRARLHAIWALANSKVEQNSRITELLRVARIDPEPNVRAQAVRALADLTDPVLVSHRLDAGRGSAQVAAQLTALPADRDPRVILEIVIALGRLRWPGAPVWVAGHVSQPDATLAHAAMQTLRRCDNWPAVLKLLDRSDAAPIRAIALRAVAEQANETVVDGLIERLTTEKAPARRQQYADALTRLAKKPGPWKYWGYRPAPRTPNAVAWERTEAITRALDQTLTDSDRGVRLAVLQRMRRETIPVRVTTLCQLLHSERDEAPVAAMLEALREHPAESARTLLVSVATQKKHAPANRQTALAIFEKGLDAQTADELLDLASDLEDGPVLADALRYLGKYPKLMAQTLITTKLTSSEATVRAAAAEAAGKFVLRSAADALLALTKDSEVAVRRASLEALRQLKDQRVVPLAVAALDHPATQVTALQSIGELGGPEHGKTVAAVARRNPSSEVLPLAFDILSKWNASSDLSALLAELQGASGVLARWHIGGPYSPNEAEPNSAKLVRIAKRESIPVWPVSQWPAVVGVGADARIRPVLSKAAAADTVWLGYSEFVVPADADVQFLGASNGPVKIWVNGQVIHERNEIRTFVPDAERFDAKLPKGENRIVLQVGPVKGQPEFHFRFRKKSSTANHEQLAQAALSRTGDKERGRKLFLDVAKSQCLKCHRHGDQGERIGPDLTGIGKRFARIYLIESILEPGRTIAPSYDTLHVQLKDGRVLTGVRMAETPAALTLGDAKGDKHMLPRTDIDEVRPLTISTMPEGLERTWTTDDFVDLIAFLTELK